MRKFILADNQELTKSGWLFFLQLSGVSDTIVEVETKKELIQELNLSTDAVVILDYTLFDLESIAELSHLQTKFSNADWIICSDELSDDFIRQLIYTTQSFSILLKNSSTEEFQSCLKQVMKRNRYISSQISNLLFEISKTQNSAKREVLTPTEKEILKDMALGKSTKDIASLRHISVHTVMTHRKNIFRKIEVNNVHEATKYAMRAGIVDLTEYYI